MVAYFVSAAYWCRTTWARGVSRACRYESDLNPTYQELATHYGTAVVPAQVGKPRHKGLISYCTTCAA